jgi:hypothetical protein
MKKAILLFWVLFLLQCSSKFKLLTEVDNRIGEYTFDRNARVLLIGKIDKLRIELYEQSLEQNYEGEYKAYKKAQKVILEKADMNKDKHITVDEIYDLDVEKVTEEVIKQEKSAPPVAEKQLGDYTVEKDAQGQVMAQIDQLRQELYKRKDQNYANEDEATKHAQELVLEHADANKDKRITPDEINNLDLQKVRAAITK